MKASAVALAVILASLVSARAVTTNQQAFTYFTDASGNVGFAYVTRQTDPTTNLTTTTLYYSFCVQTTVASCQEGSGVIPNNAFTGTLDGNSSKAETVKLLADTTVAGFVNELCNGPDPFGGCQQGTSPATGGLITLTYTTKRGHRNNVQLGQFGRNRTNVWRYPGMNTLTKSAGEGNLLALPTVVIAKDRDTLCGLAIDAGFLNCQPIRDEPKNQGKDLLKPK